MFQTTIRPSYNNSENMDNLTQRKPGNNLLSRKPFIDRSVNSKTPDTNRPMKSVTQERDTIMKPASPQNNLSAEEYTFSFKEFDDPDDDVWPPVPSFGKQGVLQILRNFCNQHDTPPPSPNLWSSKVDLPIFDIPTIEPKYNDIWQSLDTDMSLYEDFGTEVPQMEEYDDSF